EAKWMIDQRKKQRNTVSYKNENVSLKEVLDKILGNMVFELGFVIIKDKHILVMTKDELARAEAYSTGSGIAWNDDEGDSESVPFAPSDWKKPDVTKVEIECKNNYLCVTITFKDNLKPMLDRKNDEGEHRGYSLVQLYLDTDNNEKTGDPMSWNPRRIGYDYCLEISSGFEVTDDNGNEITQWGNIRSIVGVHNVTKTLVTYTIWKSGSGSRAKDPDGKEPQDLTTIQSNKVTAKVHYESLRLKAGQKIRVCCEDNTQCLMEEGRISDDGLCTLK
ncbi:MAG: hypothetical protein ABIH42_01640, partial [Planctomycetota bacterium]